MCLCVSIGPILYGEDLAAEAEGLRHRGDSITSLTVNFLGLALPAGQFVVDFIANAPKLQTLVLSGECYFVFGPDPVGYDLALACVFAAKNNPIVSNLSLLELSVKEPTFPRVRQMLDLAVTGPQFFEFLHLGSHYGHFRGDFDEEDDTRYQEVFWFLGEEHASPLTQLSVANDFMMDGFLASSGAAKLQKLNIDLCDIYEYAVDRLVTGLSASSIQELDLTFHELADADALDLLATYVQRTPTSLKRLSIRTKRPQSLLQNAIVPALCGNETIQQVTLSGVFNPFCAAHLKDLLSQNQHLKVMTCVTDGFSFTSAWMQSIVEGLSQNATLETLRLQCTEATDSAFISTLFQGIVDPRYAPMRLKTIAILGGNMREQIARDIAAAIRHPAFHLQELILGSKDILGSTESRELNLGDVDWADSCFNIILSAVQESDSLKKLEFVVSDDRVPWTQIACTLPELKLLHLRIDQRTPDFGDMDPEDAVQNIQENLLTGMALNGTFESVGFGVGLGLNSDGKFPPVGIPSFKADVGLYCMRNKALKALMAPQDEGGLPVSAFPCLLQAFEMHSQFPQQCQELVGAVLFSLLRENPDKWQQMSD